MAKVEYKDLKKLTKVWVLMGVANIYDDCRELHPICDDNVDSTNDTNGEVTIFEDDFAVIASSLKHISKADRNKEVHLQIKESEGIIKAHNKIINGLKGELV